MRCTVIGDVWSLSLADEDGVIGVRQEVPIEESSEVLQISGFDSQDGLPGGRFAQ
jgi:hypothetical protein